MSLLKPRKWFFSGYLTGFIGGLYAAGYYVSINDPHYFRPASVVSYYYQIWTYVVAAVIVAMVISFVWLLWKRSPRVSAPFGMMMGFTITYYLLFPFATLLLIIYAVSSKES